MLLELGPVQQKLQAQQRQLQVRGPQEQQELRVRQEVRER